MALRIVPRPKSNETMTIREVVESVVLSSFLAFIVISLFKSGVAHSAMTITDEEVEKIENSSKIIGKIVSFATTTNAPKVLWGEKVAAEGRAINEGEKIFTVAGQNIEVLLNDGSRIEIAPSTTVEFTNWNKRDGDNHLVREILITKGMAYFKVKKVYSQVEPLVVTTPQAAVSVVGTQFVVDTGQSSALLRSVDRENEKQMKTAKDETEVHVFEGLVTVAKNIKKLKKGTDLLSVRAGQFTRIDSEMEKAQGVKVFDVVKYTEYVMRAIPDIKLAVNRETSQSERSMIAGNFTNSATGAGMNINRAIASGTADSTTISEEDKRDIETMKQYKKLKSATRREMFIGD